MRNLNKNNIKILIENTYYILLKIINIFKKDIQWLLSIRNKEIN